MAYNWRRECADCYFRGSLATRGRIPIARCSSARTKLGSSSTERTSVRASDRILIQSLKSLFTHICERSLYRHASSFLASRSKSVRRVEADDPLSLSRKSWLDTSLAFTQ